MLKSGSAKPFLIFMLWVAQPDWKAYSGSQLNKARSGLQTQEIILNISESMFKRDEVRVWQELNMFVMSHFRQISSSAT